MTHYCTTLAEKLINNDVYLNSCLYIKIYYYTLKLICLHRKNSHLSIRPLRTQESIKPPIFFHLETGQYANHLGKINNVVYKNLVQCVLNFTYKPISDVLYNSTYSFYYFKTSERVVFLKNNPYVF